MCKMPGSNTPASCRQPRADRLGVLMQVTDSAKREKTCFSVVSEWREPLCKKTVVMLLRGSGSGKFEITMNVQWPRPFSEIDMKLIRNHLHWCGENFQIISCRYHRWFQRFYNFNNAQFLLFESIYDLDLLNVDQLSVLWNWELIYSYHRDPVKLIACTIFSSLNSKEGLIAHTPVWWWQINYRQTSNINHTFVGNKIVAHSDVVGSSRVGAAPATSSFST